jgi:mRNA interferase RelE/StbE
MSYTIVFSKQAVKDIQRLDTVIKKRLHKKFLEVVETKDISKISKQLVNHEAGQYRLRIGDYRSIFDIDGKTIIILRVRHRKEVYR